MTAATLLVELLTEELPPKALLRWARPSPRRSPKAWQGPRPGAGRRAFPRLRQPAPAGGDGGAGAEAAAKEVTEKLMPVSVALDAEGRPTPALLKKLAAKGHPGGLS